MTTTERLHDLWVRNQARFGPAELDAYRGEWLAWSKEGDRLLFHHPDLSGVIRLVEESGRKCEDCVFQGIPEDRVADCCLGGAQMFLDESAPSSFNAQAKEAIQR